MTQHKRNKAILQLFDAIKSLGLDNVSELAESAGIPLESTRYMVWHELPKHNISYEIEIEYEALGLGRWLMEFTSPLLALGGRLQHNAVLGGGLGMIYSSRVVPGNSHLAIVAVPIGEHHKLGMEMEHLAKTGVVSNYSLREIRSMRSLSFNPSFYDFRESRWSFAWKDIEALHERKRKRLGTIPEERKADSSAKFDYKDLLILREFQKKIPKSISKLSKPLGLDHFNIRYHYNHHARRAILGYRLKIVPQRPAERSSFVFLFSPADSEDDTLEMARSVALSLPFTDSEWETAKKEYCWSASCPGEYTNELLRFTSNKFAKIRGELRILTLDSTNEFRGTIPCQFYDEKNQKWSYAPRISSAKPNASFQELKNTCRYEADMRCLVNETDPRNCTTSICPFAAR